MINLPLIKGRNPRLLLFFIALGNLWLTIFTWRQSFVLNGNRIISLFDDALISMSYAKTFSQTGELIWFPGASRVQGITNPFWTLVLSLLHLISDNPQTVIYLVITLGFITINVTAILVYKILGLALPVSKHRATIQIAASASIPFQYSYVYWTLRGMEVGILSLVLLLTIYIISKNTKMELYPKDYLKISLLGFIGTGVRFDYILIHVVVVAFLIIYKKFNFLNKSKFSKIAIVLAPLFGIMFLILVGQKNYYGEFLPNTYYLKVSGFEIHTRIIRGLLSILKSYLPPLVLLSSTILLINRKQQKDGLGAFSRLNLSIVIALISYVIYIGGDAWEVYGKINRFLSVVQPLLIITTSVGIHLLLSIELKKSVLCKWLIVVILASSLGYGIRINPTRYSVVFVSVVMLIYFLLIFSIVITQMNRCLVVNLILFFILTSNTLAFASWLQSGARDGLDTFDQQSYQIALDIKEVLSKDGRVAVIFAGAPIYFSNKPGIDLLGKNDTYIANLKPNFDDFVGEWNSSFYPGHNKWDFNYSIGYLKPDMVAQSWGKTSVQDLGYEKFCLIGTSRSYFFNSKSKNLWWNKLEYC